MEFDIERMKKKKKGNFQTMSESYWDISMHSYGWHMSHVLVLMSIKS